MSERLVYQDRVTTYDNPEKRGWFMGPFMEKEVLKTDDLRINFCIHKKGWSRESVPQSPNEKTVVILGSGHLVYWFDGDKQFYHLEKPGDYLVWEPSIHHVSAAVEDSTLVNVRWTIKE